MVIFKCLFYHETLSLHLFYLQPLFLNGSLSINLILKPLLSLKDDISGSVIGEIPLTPLYSQEENSLR